MTGCGILLQFILDVASQSSCCGWSFLLAFCVGEQLIAVFFSVLAYSLLDLLIHCTCQQWHAQHFHCAH